MGLLTGRSIHPGWHEAAVEAGVPVVGFTSAVSQPLPAIDDVVPFGDVARAADGLLRQFEPERTDQAPTGLDPLAEWGRSAPSGSLR